MSIFLVFYVYYFLFLYFLYTTFILKCYLAIRAYTFVIYLLKINKSINQLFC